MQHYLIRRLLFWLGMLPFLGIFIGFIYLNIIPLSAFTVLGMSILVTYVTCLPSMMLSYFLLYQVRKELRKVNIPLFLTLANLVSFSSYALGLFLVALLFDFNILEQDNYIRNFILPESLMILGLTFGVTMLEKNVYVLPDKENTLPVVEEPRMDVLLERGDREGNTGCLPVIIDQKSMQLTFAGIYYLTANGPNTVIHTEAGDYEVKGFLKDYQEQLCPELFTRVHRKFILNTYWLQEIQCLRGAYTASLKDEDETSLPVGRTYLAELKSRFN